MNLMMKTTPLHRSGRSASRSQKGSCLAALFLVWLASGCSSGTSSGGTPPPITVPPAPQTYFVPGMAGQNISGLGITPSNFVIDRAATTFLQNTDGLSRQQSGVQASYGGTLAPLARGLLNLGLTYSYAYPKGTTYDPPQPGGYGLELPGQAGGFMQITGQPVLPMVAAETCPSNTTAQTFQFVTLPGTLTTSKSTGLGWNPNTDSVFGSVDISGTGETVTFANIQQFTLPTKGSPGAPSNPATSPTTGACASTFYGNVISVPGTVIITNPTPGSIVPPQAVVGIGPTGLLVESNGNFGGGTPPYYENLLGAGTGAIGLPKPSSPVDTTALVAAQYLGFFYGSGINSQQGSLSSPLASFGFPTVLPTCKTAVAAATATLIYGGTFANNNPVTTTGYPTTCNAGIDLGTEDPNNNGLYPGAKIYFGTAFLGNQIGTKYPIPAVAIAGQLNGKYAIFVVGVDTTGTPQQGWGIYLLQSN